MINPEKQSPSVLFTFSLLLSNFIIGFCTLALVHSALKHFLYFYHASSPWPLLISWTQFLLLGGVFTVVRYFFPQSYLREYKREQCLFLILFL